MARGKTASPRGRPRGFDCEQALDRAMRVFREKGYEGASLPVLTRAMGINRPSLYAAFGNKESLFRRVIERYTQQVGEHVQAALDLPTSRQVAHRLLSIAIGSQQPACDAGRPMGCLLVSGALACGEEGEAVRRELIRRRGAIEVLLRTRLDRAKTDGDLPARCDPAALAKFIATLMHGLSVQLASNATREELSKAVEVAMHAWPG